MCKIAHILPRCQNSILSFEIPLFRLKNAKLSSSPGSIIHQFRGLIVEMCAKLRISCRAEEGMSKMVETRAKLRISCRADFWRVFPICGIPPKNPKLDS